MGSASGRVEYFRSKIVAFCLLAVVAVSGYCGPAVALGVATGRTVGSFAVSPSGAAIYTIPVWTPAGIHGVQPNLALVYSSAGGDGLYGMGWNLSGLAAITRCPKSFLSNGIKAAPSLSSSDIFCLNGNKLRSFAGTTYGQDGAQYQTELADFSLVISHGTAGAGPAWFEVHGKDGLIYQYGNTTDSALLATGTTSVLEWSLNRISDRLGNHLDVVYTNDAADQVLRPSTITYTTPPSGAAGVQATPNYQVAFTYVPRVSLTPTGYVVGAAWSEPYLTQTITVSAFNGSAYTAVKTYNLTYIAGGATTRGQLESVQECSPTQCFPSTTIAYQSGATGWGAAIASTGNLKNFFGSGFLGDLNGDGLQDMVYPDPTSGHWYYMLGSAAGSLSGPYDTGVVTTTALYGMDFRGDGKTDLLLRNGSGNWRVMFYQSPGAAFTFTDTTSPAPNLPTGLINLITGDVDGDGREDVIYVVSGGAAWSTNDALYYQLNNGSGFGAPTQIFATSNVTGGGIYHKLGQMTWTGSSHLRHPDFNGDGRIDFFIVYESCSDTDTKCASGKGISTSTVRLYASDPTGVTYSVRGGTAFLPLIGDYNGDGCADIAYPTPAGSGVVGYYWTFQYGTCDRSGASSILSPPVTTTTIAYNQVPVAIDWDGDGMDDIVEPNGYPSGTWGYEHSTGTGLAPWSTLGITFNGYNFALPADVTGDGLPDIIYPAAGSFQATVLPHNGATVTPDLAISFTDGFGVNYSPTYAQITNSSVYTKGTGAVYPEQDYPGPMTVVSSYSASNGIGGSYTVTESYIGARFNVQSAGFEGFATLKSVDNRNGIETDRLFSQTFPNTGMLSQQIQYQPSSSKIISNVVNTNTYAQLDTTVNNNRWFPYVSQSVETNNEVGGTLDNAAITQVTTAYTFAGANAFNYGNPSKIVRTTLDQDSTSPWAGATFTDTVNITPYEVGGSAATGWCIHLPSQVVETRAQTSGSQAHTTSVGVNALNECEVDSQTVEPSSTTDRVVTALGYDGCGNLNSIALTGQNPDGTAMAARATTYNYGSHCLDPESITDAMLQSTAIGYRYDLGLPTSITDQNSLTTSWTYNDIGQKTLEQRPDGTQSAWTFTLCSSPSYCGNSNLRYGVLRTENDSSSGHAAYWDANQYFDQFSRVIFDEPLQSNGVQVSLMRTYDALGRLATSSNPFGNGFSYFTTTFTYDLLNRETSQYRPTSAANPTLQYTYYGYRGRTQTIQDPRGFTTTKQSNVLGQLGIVTDADGVSKTLYAYEPFGKLASVRDSAGNVAIKSYDTLGYLQIASADPDRGGTTYEFDSLGELVHARDARTTSPAWTQALSYDVLGRLIQRVEAEGTSTLTWGTSAAAHEIGHLSQLTGLGETEIYGYDGAGRLASRSMSWGGNTYAVSFNYNSIGKLTQLTYPVAPGQSSAFALLYGYTNGYLSSIQKYTGGVAGRTFWQLTPGVVNMDPWGNVIDETLGTTTAVRIQSAYDAVTSWLNSRTVGSGGSVSNLQSLSYQWDPNGNLTTRQDQLQGLSEVITYDSLNRLQTSTLNGVQNLAVSIDSSGNITSRTEGGITYPYTYDATHVHAVSTVGSGANQTAYTYDADGNMQTRNGATLHWASFNLPTMINGSGGATSSFSYGPGRQRIEQDANYVSDGASGSESTIYAFGLYERETTSFQQHNKYFIYTPGGTKIIYDIPSRSCPQVTYVTSDHLGSGNLFLNNSGTVIMSQSFSAYGYRRSSNWSGALSPTSSDYTTIAGTTRRGYTEAFHEFLDNLGLIHMGGRVYDPVIGRFLSPDPVAGDAGSSQSWNPYSYVNNKPLSSFDPTGFASVDNNRDGDSGLGSGGGDSGGGDGGDGGDGGGSSGGGEGGGDDIGGQDSGFNGDEYNGSEYTGDSQYLPPQCDGNGCNFYHSICSDGVCKGGWTFVESGFNWKAPGSGGGLASGGGSAGGRGAAGGPSMGPSPPPKSEEGIQEVCVGKGCPDHASTSTVSDLLYTYLVHPTLGWIDCASQKCSGGELAYRMTGPARGALIAATGVGAAQAIGTAARALGPTLIATRFLALSPDALTNIEVDLDISEAEELHQVLELHEVEERMSETLEALERALEELKFTVR